ncbi:lytic polysaccharide monooxygenase [Enterobacteriaceae bacterium BIT-l23]|uniref:lytic polysaccharide monooxygenase n=1 Tax=Jejubacter sp. L23 TaxID=3092086 RepID=UPI001584972F|nr:lytic polysaccharide monooxygenase [Enterobacteriaceae bacterium BIT-l23]
MNMNKCFITGLVVTFILNTGVIQTASAHGYVSTPESRAFLCKKGQNIDCGTIKYEPQSVEGPKNFPAEGPANGTIASGGNSRFPELDAQSPNRWAKVNLHTGNNSFIWTLTQAHKTTNWRYFITRQGWDSSKKLERNSFDLIPFCQINGNDAVPVSPVQHTCSIPSDRSGYHVILATWDIADTGNAFYQVIDANIIQ